MESEVHSAPEAAKRGARVGISEAGVAFES